MPDEPVCARYGCGHPESSHDGTVLYCEDCACTGFLTPETFESVPEYEGEDGS